MLVIRKHYPEKGVYLPVTVHEGNYIPVALSPYAHTELIEKGSVVIANAKLEKTKNGTYKFFQCS